MSAPSSRPKRCKDDDGVAAPSDVERECERSVRDLLRSLGDIQRLDRHPLVAAYFRCGRGRDARSIGVAARADAVHAWVCAAVERLSGKAAPRGTRQREIIFRCDIRGESHKQVMHDLCLSRRTFYYERRDALRTIASWLAPDGEGTASVVDRSMPDPGGTLVRGALTLHHAGQTGAALRLLRDAVPGSRDAVEVARLHATVAWLHAERGDRKAAFNAVEQAEHLLRSSPSEIATAEIAFAMSAALWNSGATTQALAQLELVLSASPAATELSPEALHEIRMRAALALTAYRQFLGVRDGARSALALARAEMAVVDDPPAYVRAALELACAAASLLDARPLVVAMQGARNVQRLASRHGLLLQALEATNLVGVIEEMRGDGDAASRALDEAMRLAAIRANPAQVAIVGINAARARAATNDTNGARQLLHDIVASAETGEALGALVGANTALILLREQRYADAAALTGRLIGDCERLGLDQLEGRVRRTSALALAALGDREGAGRRAEDAVAILERHGSYHALAEAHATMAQISRDGHHRKKAREMRAVLAAK